MSNDDFMALLGTAFAVTTGDTGSTEVVRAELWDGGRLRVRRRAGWSTTATWANEAHRGLTAHLLATLDLDAFPALPSAFVAEASAMLAMPAMPAMPATPDEPGAVRVHLGSIPGVGPLAVLTKAPPETLGSLTPWAEDELTPAWEEAMSHGLAKMEEGDLEGCFLGLDGAVAAAEAMGPRGHGALGIALSHIGQLRLEDNRPDLSRAALERAVTLEIEGEAPDILVERLHLLAMTCARMSEPNDAITTLELAVSILEAAFGAEDLGLHPLLVDIASLAQDGGDHEAAQAALDRWQAIRSSVLEA